MYFVLEVEVIVVWGVVGEFEEFFEYFLVFLAASNAPLASGPLGELTGSSHLLSWAASGRSTRDQHV
jgi:hypothetical protein